MEVRRLNSADLNEYFALRLEALKSTPDAFLVTYEEEKERGNGFFAGILAREDQENVIFGGFIDGILVGIAGVFKEDKRVKTAHKATLWGMYVRENARGTGLARNLVAAVIVHARKRMGAQSLYCCVEGGNGRALALYDKMGFRVWGREPKAYKIGEEYREDAHLWLDLAAN